MAKKPNEDSAVDSGFDFTKFLDFDEAESQYPGGVGSSGIGYESIPFGRNEIVTGELNTDLAAAVESYIRAGKVSRSAKKNLRLLAAENGEIETTLKETDAAILERADGYDEIVSKILREKNQISDSSFLDDSDPYDSKPANIDQSTPESRDARLKSNELFKEIEELEEHRTGLNERRIDILNDVLNLAEKQRNGSWEYLDDIAGDKLSAIAKVKTITKVDFSDEDEEDFDRGMDSLTGYIQGDFDPLADEDEYSSTDDSGSNYEDQPLSEAGHTEQEILAMEEANSASEEPKSFSDLFQSSEESNSSESSASESEFHDAFSSSESAEDLHAALGDDSFDPDLDDGTGEDDVTVAEWEQEATVDSDLRDEDLEDESPDEEAVVLAENSSYDQPEAEEVSDSNEIEDAPSEPTAVDEEARLESDADELDVPVDSITEDSEVEAATEDEATDEAETEEGSETEAEDEFVSDEFTTPVGVDEFVENSFSDEDFDEEPTEADSFIGNLEPIYAGTPIFDALKAKYGINL